MCQAEYHYATAVVEDFVPELSQTVMEWLPENCLRDDRFEAARQWDEKTVPKYETLADCRDLNTIVWLGATNVSTSTHYDVSHNLFFQTYGRKRFTLLPPKVHSSLRLFPYWHGSNRQAQAPHPLEHECKAMGEDEDDEGTYSIDLVPGDVLFVPPRWFHKVESITPNIGINWWTGGLDRDVWMYVLGASGGGDEETAVAWSGGTRFGEIAQWA